MNQEELKATLLGLNSGDVFLIEATGANGGKVQLTFAEKIDNPNARPGSIVALANESDERFTQSGGPRLAWIAGIASDIKKNLGIDVPELEKDQTHELGILNHTVGGKRLHIQITETTEGTQYDVANFEKRAKRAGKDGDFIVDAEGKFIYVQSTIVAGKAQHVFIKNTERMPAKSEAEETVESRMDS